jgi:protein involved in polysaccharide export with SLBB domain
VANAGKYLFKDGERLRVTDALAAAGGLASRGTMRRVYLVHPTPDGRTTVTMFHLDDYLKNGDLSANPEIQPGDSLFFGQPKGITISNVVQVVSAALLFESLIKN